MSKHPDAAGYLSDLAKEVGEPWFEMVCDLAAVSGVTALDNLTRNILLDIYIKKTSYTGVKAAPSIATTTVPVVSADALERLSGFKNFKRLGDTLGISFEKRISLIFGANGSGKSSLCESLKVLANIEPPNRPLQNVRLTGAANPEFQYKFRSDAAQQAWTSAVGYGPRRTTIKYFDAAVAITNVNSAVEPGRIIVLSPFRLHVFEWAKALTTEFRGVIQQAQRLNLEELSKSLAGIRVGFARFNGRALSIVDESTVATLAEQIAIGKNFNDHQLLGEKQAAAVELEKASSEEGLKLLRAEHRELESFLDSLNIILTSADSIWEIEPVIKAQTLADKQLAQRVLADALIPQDGTLDSLLALLRAALPLCKMDAPLGHVCPLCKRDLGVPEIDLFKRYHELLTGKLEEEILVLKGDIDRASNLAITVLNVDRTTWEKYTTIPEDIRTFARTSSDLIIYNCDVSKVPAPGAKEAIETLKTSAAAWQTQLQLKKQVIDGASRGRDALAQELAKLRHEIEPLEYAQAIANSLDKIEEAQRMASIADFWNLKVTAFTPLLKKITDKAKEAYEELVVTDFETRLNAEYLALAEKDMAAFGVTLSKKGADASVTVLPQIGGKEINRVLSEGEQRLHALALFFAELETCAHSVLVFDDPVSSFDYNYIENYCIRLKEFARKHPSRQIIVLTHNWEYGYLLDATDPKM